jgi:unsaturated chondroitin disaccharide hydrolase
MNTFRILQTVVLILVLAIGCSKEKKQAFDTDKMLTYCVSKARMVASLTSVYDSLPRNILQHQTQWNRVGIHDWCSGFWPGILWYAYEASGDTVLANQAGMFTEPLQGVLDVPVDNHDLGFMLYCSLGNAYRLTHDSVSKEILLRAADSLSVLFNPKVGAFLSWPAMRAKMNWPHNTIIDNMMNLELLFWASKNGGGNSLSEMAVKHAETSMNTLVRTDYTTFHVAVFDTSEGHFIKGVTHQGFSDSSMWTRGQAWAIYGYSMCFRETGRMDFLETAQNLADVFINRLPADGIPYWDCDDPSIPDAPKDASAAAIAASALLELSTFMNDDILKGNYKNAAVSLLTKLSTSNYLSGKKNQAFLLHSTGHKPKGTEIDASIIYADYYYLEALMRLRKMEHGTR